MTKYISPKNNIIVYIESGVFSHATIYMCRQNMDLKIDYVLLLFPIMIRYVLLIPYFTI